MSGLAIPWSLAPLQQCQITYRPTNNGRDKNSVKGIGISILQSGLYTQQFSSTDFQYGELAQFLHPENTFGSPTFQR